MLPWLALWAAVTLAETGIQEWSRTILLERLKQEMEDRLLEQLQVKSRSLRLEVFERADLHDLLGRARETATPGFFLGVLSATYAIITGALTGVSVAVVVGAWGPVAPGGHRPCLPAGAHSETDPRPGQVLPVSHGDAAGAPATVPGRDAHRTGRRQGSSDLRPRIGPDRLVGAPLLERCRPHIQASSQALDHPGLPVGLQPLRAGRRRRLVGVGRARGRSVGRAVSPP